MPRSCTHVSFQARFPKEHSQESPAGAELATALAECLRVQGVEVLGQDKTDYSHTLKLRIGGCIFHAMLGLVDDAVREWLFFFQPGGSVFMRLFSRLSSAQQLSLGRAVQAALSSMSSVSNVRWYQSATVWNQGEEREFSVTPEA